MQSMMMDTPLTITSIMAFAEKAHPQTEVVSVTLDNPRHRYTLADAFGRMRQLANAMQKLGLEPGDRVATLAWNDYRHFELYYAVSCSGMVCHTINPRLFPEQLEFIINQAEDQYIFVDPLLVPILENIKEKIPVVKGFVVLTDEAHMPATSLPNVSCYETLIAAESSEFEWPQLDETSASVMCYTSGTTGNPKGVVYNHRSTVLQAYAGNMADALGVTRNDVMMPIVPMFHVNAWGAPYAALMTGTKLIFPGPKMADGETLVALINEEKVTLSSGVPTIWLALLKYLKDSGKTIDTLKRVVVGGAACPISIMEEFDHHGVYTHAAWGMTEMSPLGTVNCHLDREVLGEEAFATMRLKAGRPIYGVELKITDSDGAELPWDGVAFGELKVRGPWVISQYYKREDVEALDAEGWFDTGDVATIDKQGFMQITDRTKDVIKSGGEWISSIDLENTAVNHPDIHEAAVIGVYHEKWTERPLLLVVKNEGAELSTEQVLASFKGKVASWWIPEDCVFVEELPHTATGKLDKKLIREQFKDYQFPAAS